VFEEGHPEHPVLFVVAPVAAGGRRWRRRFSAAAGRRDRKGLGC
jgi:hypothetical protein